MKALIYYTKSNNVYLRQLINDIRETIDSSALFYCNSFEELAVSLQAIHHDCDIMCLIASNTLELERLLSLKNFLKDRKLIIVLPGGVKKFLLNKVFQVYPKYIGYLDETYFFSTAVLSKMIKQKCILLPPKTMENKQAIPITQK